MRQVGYLQELKRDGRSTKQNFLEVFNSIHKCSFYKCFTNVLRDFYVLYLVVHSEANKVLVGYTG